ncbi:MAG: type II toxin-antitoxin system RelE/ParE family toxin, partial [bacterium]|jgi:proteic killer suppression protein|tara:strand:- start:503 stop:781 length:279 start_codon:yes stop_codon:yes gene_type:complete
MVNRIRHRGLRKFYEDGTTKGLDSGHVRKLRLILAALDAAEAPGDVDIAGWRLHALKGSRKGEWSVWVSGNWRVTFRFDGTNATDVCYEDYH